MNIMSLRVLIWHKIIVRTRFDVGYYPENTQSTLQVFGFNDSSHHSRNSSLASYFHLQFMAFESPFLSEFPETFHKLNMDIFRNHT